MVKNDIGSRGDLIAPSDPAPPPDFLEIGEKMEEIVGYRRIYWMKIPSHLDDDEMGYGQWIGDCGCTMISDSCGMSLNPCGNPECQNSWATFSEAWWAKHEPEDGC